MGKIARKSQNSDYGDCWIKQLPWIDNVLVKIVKSTYAAVQSVKIGAFSLATRQQPS